MDQFCKNCEAPYHVNMGLFGMDERKTQKCPHCNSLIYTSSGQVVPQDTSPDLSSIQIIKEAFTPDSVAKGGNSPASQPIGDTSSAPIKSLSFIKKILLAFGFLWVLVSIAIISHGVYLYYRSAGNSNYNPQETIVCCFVGILLLNWATVLFYFYKRPN